jgi:hypothetical protein
VVTIGALRPKELGYLRIEIASVFGSADVAYG